MNKLFNYFKLSFLFSILFCAFFIISCEYETTEIYNVDLTKPSDAPPLDINLNLMTDTVNFYWASHVNLTVSSTILKVKTVKFYLDNIEYYGNSIGNTHSILLSFSEPGIHKFKMTIITNSGSNSIADNVGVEGFIFNSREWTLIAKEAKINNNLTSQIKDNKLLLSWKEYDGNDFKSYRIRGAATGNSSDIKTAEYYYASYVGEEDHYRVYVIDNSNTEHLWGECYVNKSLPVLKLGSINNQIALTWNQSIFKDNISQYQVFRSDIYTNWTKIGTLSNNDTSIILNNTGNTFAQIMNFYLYCVPKGYTQLANTSLFSSFLQNVFTAIPGPRFDNNMGVTCSGFYFEDYSLESNKSILYKYSSSTDKVTAVMDYIWASTISPNAKYMLGPHDSIVDLYDLNTNTIVKSTNMKTIAKVFYPSMFPKISDNGICIFNSEDRLYVYDLLNSKLIGTKNMYQYGLKISSNGQYFAINKEDSLLVYQVNSNSISLSSGIKKASGFYYYDEYGFFPNQPNYLYLYQPPYLYIKSCIDLSTIRTMYIGDYLINIDFCSNKILTARNATVWDIYDLNTGSLLRTINTAIGTGASNYTLLTNNTIYFTGYKYYLGN